MGNALPTYPAVIAERLRSDSRLLSVAWLERLNTLLVVEREEIFPTEQLLDHVPELINELAAYLVAPAVEELAANTSVVAKARELGLLRHTQQASVHQLLREYHLLGAILETFIREETERLELRPSPGEVLTVAARMSHALRVLQQTTVDAFIAEYTDTIAKQQAQLQGFNRLVSHELRLPLGTLQFALRMLRDAVPDDPEGAPRLLDAVERSAVRLVELTEQLERVSGLRTEMDDPGHQEVQLTALAKEVARQLRQMAELRNVEIRIADDLPVVTIDVARLELALMNLLSNAIKYSDPAKPERFVEVFLSGASADGRTICVRDNGIGVAEDALPFIFRDFFRAHAGRDQELGTRGSGLGLAIVADCIEAIGGRITVASVEGEGTAFDIWLPPAEG